MRRRFCSQISPVFFICLIFDQNLDSPRIRHHPSISRLHFSSCLCSQNRYLCFFHQSAAIYRVSDLVFSDSKFQLICLVLRLPSFSHYFCVVYGASVTLTLPFRFTIFKHRTLACYRSQQSCYYFRLYCSKPWRVNSLRTAQSCDAEPNNSLCSTIYLNYLTLRLYPMTQPTVFILSIIPSLSSLFSTQIFPSLFFLVDWAVVLLYPPLTLLGQAIYPLNEHTLLL